MRAAIYARYSSDLQRDRSIEDQAALCRGYAAREGLTVVATFEDRALSGASLMGRDGIWQMMAAAQSGQFKIVIVEELDRLSRDMEDLAGLFKRLQFAGVEIRSVHSGTADTVQIGIRGLLGQLFLQDLKHKVRRGMAGVVREGRYAGGRAYGYRPVPGQPGALAIDEAEAAVVRRIFASYAAGESPRTIAGALNAEGIPAPRGARWNASTINGGSGRHYGILINPVYGGRIVWNRTHFVKDPATGRRVPRLNAKEEWHETAAEHLRIIDPALHAAALARKTKNQSTPQAANHRHKRVLSGLMRCACCGGGIVSMGKDKPQQPTRIGCSTVKESGSCSARAKIPLPPVEHSVLTGLSEALLDRQAIALYVRTYNEERARLAADADGQRAALARRKAKAETELARARDLAVAGILTAQEAAAQIATRRADLEQIEHALASLASPVMISINPAIVDSYRSAIASLGDTLADVSNQEALATVRNMISRVTVDLETRTIEVEGAIPIFGGESGSGGGI